MKLNPASIRSGDQANAYSLALQARSKVAQLGESLGKLDQKDGVDLSPKENHVVLNGQKYGFGNPLYLPVFGTLDRKERTGCAEFEEGKLKSMAIDVQKPLGGCRESYRYELTAGGESYSATVGDQQVTVRETRGGTLFVETDLTVGLADWHLDNFRKQS